MRHQVLFIQGAGQEGYLEDRKLVNSLRAVLGPMYEVQYPQMPDADRPNYAAWKMQIVKELAELEGEVVLVGHSLGASLLLNLFSAEPLPRPVMGLFLLAAPYWGALDWEVDEYTLPTDFALTLPAALPVFLYHCHDDQVVPFSHLALYQEKLPLATIYELEHGGHQFTQDVSAIAQDIWQLSNH